MSILTCAVALFCASNCTEGALQGSKCVSRAVEIDFAPLPTGRWYDVIVAMECEGMTTVERQDIDFGVIWTFDGDGPTKARNAIEWYFQEHGWTVQRAGNTKLIVKDYKGRPVTAVRISVERIPASMTPKTDPQ